MYTCIYKCIPILDASLDSGANCSNMGFHVLDPSCQCVVFEEVGSCIMPWKRVLNYPIAVSHFGFAQNSTPSPCANEGADSTKQKRLVWYKCLTVHFTLRLAANSCLNCHTFCLQLSGPHFSVSEFCIYIWQVPINEKRYEHIVNILWDECVHSDFISCK